VSHAGRVSVAMSPMVACGWTTGDCGALFEPRTSRSR
jgi:hypothetical protein